MFIDPADEAEAKKIAIQRMALEKSLDIIDDLTAQLAAERENYGRACERGEELVEQLTAAQADNEKLCEYLGPRQTIEALKKGGEQS
jgi:hypothetical protein